MESSKKAKIKAGGQGPIRRENFFRRSLVIIALALVVLVAGIFLTLIIESIPSLKALGIKYLWGKTWDPVNNVYGALPFIIGTLLTSFIALIIAMPFSYAIAVYLGEFNPKGWLSNLLKNIVDLIAAVPSVIYGFWGFLILVPAVQKMEMAWNAKKIGEYRAIKPENNSMVIKGDSLVLNKDYIPLAYSGSASIDDSSMTSIMAENSSLPDSVKQGHPFIYDIGPIVTANKGKAIAGIVNDSIKQAEARIYNKDAAAALLVINSSGLADSLQFNKNDTTTQLDVAVVYITDAARKKYFDAGAGTTVSASIKSSIDVVDPYNVDPYGTGIFTSSIILAIMIIPYAASMGRELIKMVPSSLKEGAYALGATRYEVIKNVVIPYTKSGLAAGVLLSLGRALGETMAVTMVIGNSPVLPKGIFSLGHTMASVIANEFAEADHTVYTSALVELGLVLFLVTVAINMIGKGIIKRFTHE